MIFNIASRVKPDFVFEIVVTSATLTITLPLVIAHTYNATVNWGDAIESTITAYDDADRAHTYAATGTYRVRISGAFPAILITGGTIATALSRIIHWGSTGLTTIRFQDCVNLVSLPEESGLLSGLTSTNFIFKGCTSLSSSPVGTFWGITASVKFESTFEGCTSLTYIRSDTFRYSTNVTTNGFKRTFCESGLTATPDNLFRNQTNLTTDSFHQTFAGADDLADVSATTFAGATSCKSFWSTFHTCGSVTELPDDIFRYNTAVTTFEETFNSSALQGLPDDIFRYNTAVTTFEETFRDCIDLASVPEDLFRYNTAVTSFSGTLRGTEKLIPNGNIFGPSSLYSTRFYNQDINFNSFFYLTPVVLLDPEDYLGGTLPALWDYDYGSGTIDRTHAIGGFFPLSPESWKHQNRTNAGDVPLLWKW